MSPRPPTSTPRVGSSNSSRVTFSFSRQRPRKIFCWLPPLSVSAAAPSRLRSNPINPARRWASVAERLRLTTPPRLTVFKRVARRLRATDWCRNKPRPGPDRPLRRAEAHGAAGDRYVTPCVRHQTRKRPQDLAGARAHLARDGDDLAAARAQSKISNMSWYRELVDDDEALAGFDVTPLDWAPLGDLAEHELNDALSIHFGGGL